MLTIRLVEISKQDGNCLTSTSGLKVSPIHNIHIRFNELCNSFDLSLIPLPSIVLYHVCDEVIYRVKGSVHVLF